MKEIHLTDPLVWHVQLEEGQARKEAGVDVGDSQRRLQYLTEPWSATEHEVLAASLLPVLLTQTCMPVQSPPPK